MSLGYSGDSPPPSPSRREAAAAAKKHKGGVERLMLSVRAKIGDALDIDGLPKEAAQLLAEAEALLRKGEQELAKPRLERIVAGIDAEDMFHGADEHARRSLLHTYTDLDPEAAAGHQATSPSRRAADMITSPKASAKQALHAEAVAKLLEKAGHFDFDAIAFAALPEVEGKPLTTLGTYLLSSCGYISGLEDNGWLDCPRGATFEGRVARFLREIDRRYLSKAIYHSSVHATDVMATTCWLLRQPYFMQRTSLLDYTVSVIAAAMHDVGHPGLNNEFQKATMSELALTYNDQSVLENFHAATAFDILTHNEDCNWFVLLSRDFRNDGSEAEPVNLQKYVRRLLITITLGTDMAKHRQHQNDCLKLAEEETGSAELPHGQAALERTELLLQNLVHAADISNPTKPRKIMLEWTKRVTQEFWAQGDEEQRLGLPISPMCNRTAEQGRIPQGQINFINFVVQPYFSCIARLCPGVGEAMESLAANKAFWEEKSREGASFDELFPAVTM
ncbi:PDE4D [Symbiodinium necroappetens]|uniref:Phosphodiesterase n=1 Tax=Symbiodinium necroappetens TaxID=1628268 RepID=A0A812NS69_9DINO|nr:PDE4D [Symbiodinium necroappetens]